MICVVQILIIYVVKVCVPIKPEECELFNPTTVPNLITLRKEIIDFDKETPEEEDTMDTAATDRKMPDYKKTSLKPYIEYFDKFVKNMLSETIKEKRGKLRL
jgi:DNA primase small subunit